MSDGADVRVEVAADLRRVSERLRSAPVARVADARNLAAALLQLLADTAQGTDQRDDAAPPQWREVPVLIDSALGDQTAVLGADLTAATSGLDDTTAIWLRSGRTTLGPALADVAARLRELRFAL